MGGETNSAAFVGATIPTVRSPILVVRWLKTSIWWQRYDGRQDQSGGVRRSHYFDGHWSHYSDGSVTDSSSMVVGDIDLAAAVWWAARPIQRRSLEPLFRRSSEPLFRRFGHQF